MTGLVTAERYHDISCGHRVYGHESKCAHLHGHNYRVTFVCSSDNEDAPTDDIGRVIDFSAIKARLCMWIEAQWDHKFLISDADPFVPSLLLLDPAGVVVVPFNPTAENMAKHLVEVVGPAMLESTGVVLVACRVEETRKCSATFTKEF